MLSRKPFNTRRKPSHCRSASPKFDTWRTFRLSDLDQRDLMSNYFQSLDHPVSLSCALLLKYKEFAQLVEKDIDPLQFNEAADFRDAFAAISFLRKFPSFNTGIDKKAVALSTFTKCEEQCKRVNTRIINGSWGNKPHDAWLLNATRRKIALFLRDVGEADPLQGFEVDHLFDLCSWGPGVTTLIKGKDTSASIKFQSERSLTRDMYHLFWPLLQVAYPGWIPSIEQELVFQGGNKVVTVPKNAKTDRTIAIEPGLNSFVQLGIGRLIRKRLRSAGFDLRSDKKNQSGALLGSRYGHLATVDFSSASDTISKRVVEELLPKTWFDAMDASRSHNYTFDGSTFQCFEKFSTMGCGFTFELESLIFVTAALACCEYVGCDTSDVSVFGDDIIIPNEAYDIYRDFCDTLGFTTNARKSYSSSYFRESCGSYFFRGEDVKPLFLKKEVSTKVDLVTFVNSIRNLAHRRNGNFGCDVRFHKLWKKATRLLGPFFLGPRDAGDLCVSSNFDEARPARARNSLDGFIYSAWIPRAVKVEHEGIGHLFAQLSFCGKEDVLPKGNSVSLRAVVRYTAKHRMFASQWYNYGPWI